MGEIMKVLKRSSVRQGFDDLMEGDVEKAVKGLERKIEGFRDEKKLGDAHHLLGYIHLTQDDEEKANKHFKRSEELRRDVKDKTGLAETLSYLGQIKKEKGNNKEAIDIWKEGAELRREEGDFQNAGTNYARIVRVYEKLDMKEKVLQYQSETVEMMNEAEGRGKSVLGVFWILLESLIKKAHVEDELSDFERRRLERFEEEYKEDECLNGPSNPFTVNFTLDWIKSDCLNVGDG